MPEFTIIKDFSEINLDKRWSDAKKLNTKEVTKNGRTYCIIKKERQFSGLERFGRRFLATLAVVFTLGLVFFADSLSKIIKKLFNKEKESVRFAILKSPLPSTDKKVASAFNVVQLISNPQGKWRSFNEVYSDFHFKNTANGELGYFDDNGRATLFGNFRDPKHLDSEYILTIASPLIDDSGFFLLTPSEYNLEQESIEIVVEDGLKKPIRNAKICYEKNSESRNLTIKLKKEEFESFKYFRVVD